MRAAAPSALAELVFAPAWFVEAPTFFLVKVGIPGRAEFVAARTRGAEISNVASVNSANTHPHFTNFREMELCEIGKAEGQMAALERTAPSLQTCKSLVLPSFSPILL